MDVGDQQKKSENKIKYDLSAQEWIFHWSVFPHNSSNIIDGSTSNNTYIYNTILMSSLFFISFRQPKGGGGGGGYSGISGGCAVVLLVKMVLFAAEELFLFGSLAITCCVITI